MSGTLFFMNTLYSRPDFYCHKLLYLTEMELVEWAFNSLHIFSL